MRNCYRQNKRPQLVALIGGAFLLAAMTLGMFTTATVSAQTTVLTVAVGGVTHVGPYAPAYDPANGDIYVTNTDGHLSVIDGATNQVVGSVAVGGGSPIAYDAANGDFYVANSDGEISVFNGSTNQVLGSVELGANSDPAGVAYDAANGDIYVSDYCCSNTVSVIDGATNQVVGSVNLPPEDNPYGLAYDPANGDIYVTNYDLDSVSVINGLTNKVVGSPIPVGNSPIAAAYDAANGDIYVTNETSNNVSVIDGATNQVISTVAVGTFPQGLAYDTANGDIYVANSDYGPPYPPDAAPDNVSVIDGSTNEVVGSPITVGLRATGVAYDPANGDIYVTNSASETVSVIETSVLITVSVTGSEVYGGSPTFTYTANAPSGVNLTGTLKCTTEGGNSLSGLSMGHYTLDGSNCSGLSASSSGYTLNYAGVSRGFSVNPAPISVSVSGSEVYDDSPTFTYTDNVPSGVSLSGTLRCTTEGGGSSLSGLGVGRYTLDGSDCSGLTASNSNFILSYTGLSGGFKVSPTQTITGPYHGKLTVTSGQWILVEGPNASLNGPVRVEAGGALDIENASISGPLEATNAASIHMCGATLSGPITVTATTGSVVIGDGGSCGGNHIAGPVRITNNEGGITFDNNTVAGPLTITGNTAPVQDTGNHVTGPAKIQ